MRNPIFTLFLIISLQVIGQSPGGVNSGLRLWLRSDKGITQTAGKVSQWNDQSGNGFHLTQTVANNQPDYKSTSELINFNPVLDFNGTSHILSRSGSIFINNFAESNTFIVSTEDVRQNSMSLQFRAGSDRTYFHFPWVDGLAYWDVNVKRIYGTYPVNVGSLAIGLITNSVTYNLQQIIANGETIAQGSSGGNATIDQVSLGGGSGAFFNGKIPELIVYGLYLDLFSRAKINTYLALKYGCTMGNSSNPTEYFSSEGVSVWNESKFHNDVFGLVRDDASALHQQIARSQTNQMITLSTDGNTTGVNGSHSNLVNDKAFLIIGHNGDTTSSVLIQ